MTNFKRGILTISKVRTRKKTGYSGYESQKSLVEFRTQTAGHVRLSLSYQAEAKILCIYPMCGVEIVCNPNRISDDLMLKEIKHCRVIHP